MKYVDDMMIVKNQNFIQIDNKKCQKYQRNYSWSWRKIL